ncbi:hypothetical protein A3206_01865 [Candidatus Methanomassiliicoccus intestinalis]|uniref:C_GCAxxG_C_C family protein n=1 Tax=Methanomassiliicoccus intestinalis (strain Issoire-Mx1) TaxID=1295009 RepID=R9TAH3_METII|nr:C-GCAxxG-C-C family protein [Candidatus Methanomassiliicoccus intestinalis]AGN26403.1 hypothetical protein MMINT_10580 [Candidatus Methanomassiliicoccus intestinalis Issoire-Mx1]TQS82423.1 MAG: hypothetical protein A3206_01865 [Candidatus Methanomassiliicoccus intestinalis]
MIAEKEIAEKFTQGFDCAMVVLGEVAEDLGIEQEEAYRLASCFGVGMMQGSICGAVSAAFIAIGYKYGNTKPNDVSQKNLVLAKREEFVEEFTNEFGDISCPGLVKLDLRIPEEMEKARERKILSEFCPKVCLRSTNLIKTILE